MDKAARGPISSGGGWLQHRWTWPCLIVTLAALLIAVPAVAQQSGSSNDRTSTSQSKQPPSPAHKSAAEENPFPADVSKQASQQHQQQGDPSTTTAPDAPDAGQQPAPQAQRPGDAAKDNPFPEDVSKGAAAAKDSDPNATDSSGSSSSSSSNPGGDTAGSDSDQSTDLPKATGRRKLRKPRDEDIQSGSLAGEGRAQEDERVGSFYLNSGNYQGAYGRFAEAVRLDPANVNAIYGLAASAAGLHHTDEALNNYKLYLAIAPDGDHAKSAAKAIHSLAK